MALSLSADVTVVFNEVMYHPDTADEASHEWVELHNQLAVDMDISGWSLTSGIDYVFPEGTVVPGGGYVVVASSPATLMASAGISNVLGPFARRLGNNGDTLELRNNNNRLMDRLVYGADDLWPVAADGAGSSLAKIDEDGTASDPSNWRASVRAGGTPGAANLRTTTLPDGRLAQRVALTSLFSSGLDPEGAALAPGAPDPHYVLTASAYSTPPPPAISATVMANHPAWLANTSASRWIGVVPGGTTGVPVGIYNFRTAFELAGMVPESVSVDLRVAADNRLTQLFLNDVDQGISYIGFSAFSALFNIASGFVEGTNTLDFFTVNDPSGNNPAGFRVETAGTGLQYIPKPTLAFNEISAAADEAFLTEIVNYGSHAVSLSNCVFRRLGVYAGEYLLPNFSLAPGERAVFNVTEFGIRVLPGDRLALYSADREYVLDAVTARHYPRARWPEGTGAWHHPAAPTFGTLNSVAFHDDVVINEIMYNPRAPQGPDYQSPEQWIELYNRGGQAADLSGWRIEVGGETAFAFAPGTTLAPDGYCVVALDADYLRALYPDITILGNLSRRLPRGGGRIELFDAAGAPLHPDAAADEAGNPADCVVYGDAAPWPAYADGLGASLELVDPRSDNSRPEAWSASDDSAKAGWHAYSYTGIATSETATSPTLWKEFVLGLIGRGELLLDDLSVVHNPSGAAAELLQNGGFDGGMAAWRIIGNHRHSEVVPDPDNAANTVLHLVSTGYAEHMHNHAETTLGGGASIVNGQEYRISFRAKWIAGCNRLLSRLYFNRLPRLTEIAMPALCGTPGARNSRYAANRGPTFRDLSHAPVVPSAGQTVSVSAYVCDPDGVTSAVLRYAVDGGAFAALPMTVTGASDGGFLLQAQIPAQPNGSIVQFYIEAFDSLGAPACAPSGGEVSRALYEVAAGGALSGGLRKIRIVMTPADAAFLHSSINVMSNDRMGCTLITDEKKAIYDAGIHLQGSQRGRPNSSRVGFNVRLPHDQPYRGVLDTITVDRSGGYSGKGGKQDEILLKHAINKVGGLPGMYDDLCQVFAPRPQEDGRGLLILAKYNSEFLDSQYRDGGQGELFKLELVYYPTTTLTGDPESYKLPNPDHVLGTDVKDLGNDPEAYRWTFLKENRRDRNHYAPMMQLAKAFSLSGAELDARMAELMDVDQWMRAIAFLSLIGNNDGYTYDNSHNAIFYFPPDNGRALLFPWDMDFSFVAKIDASFPGTGSANTLKLINRPANLHAYYGHLYALTAVTGDAAYMGEWAGRYAGLLGENWSGAVTYLSDRAAYVRSQLPAMVAFAITSNGGADFSVDHSPVVISGNGWITVKTITVNGVQYPVTWNTPTAWSITVPLPELTNLIELQAYDLHGSPLPGGTDSITVVNNGTLAPQPVSVNEWMALSNGPGGYPDPADGKFDDWFELYNPNAFPVDLSGYTLTDNLSRPDKWSVPSNTVIGAHGFLLIWADGEPEQNGSGLHASFKLNGDGEALGLFSPEGVLQHSVTFGTQVANVSQGFYPDGAGGVVSSMPCWTPAAPNRIGSPAVPDIVVFSAADGGAIIQAQTEPGHAYVIEYKNDLGDAEWLPLCTNRAMNAISSFIDPAAGVTQRFYRAVLLQ